MNQNRQIEDILNKTLYPMLITAKHTRKVVYANPYAQIQYETDLETLIGMDIEMLYTQDNQREAILSHLKEDGTVDRCEMSFKTLKGNTFYGLLSLNTIYYNNEDCFLGVVTDITTQKNQQLELTKLYTELNEYKDKLEIKIEEEIQKRKVQEEILIQKSKLASMGELIDSIAHQWMQPLSLMSLYVDSLKMNTSIDEDVIKTFEEKFSKQKNFMVDTLKEFRSFFRQNSNKHDFYVNTLLDTTIELIKDELIKNEISIIKNIKKNFTIFGIENDFIHIILNILNNAKEAYILSSKEEIYEDSLDLSNYKEKVIHISTDIIDNKRTIIIEDEAGGIDKSLIDNIFEVNVTSKEKNGGTGIGLYLSKRVIEKYNGDIKVKNSASGAKFIITL